MQVAFSTPLQYVHVVQPVGARAPSAAGPAPVGHRLWSRTASARTALARAAEDRLHWVRRLADGRSGRGPVSSAQPGDDTDWARFDAPTFLRRGIVIDGLPDWRQAGDRS